MKNKIHLIMPMGGAGSRFTKNGFEVPKPLIQINNKPFLYWATKSITNFVDVLDITFVVLEEHIKNFNIDKEIKKHFPDSNIIVLSKMLNGAVLTCMEGVKNINDNLPIIFNDCDHLFICNDFNKYCEDGLFDNMDGALLTFKSNDPKFSFLQLDENKNVIKTIEKVAISDKAICGAYYFKNKDIFLTNAKKYLEECEYSEYFMSGVYNTMIKDNEIIKNFTVDLHIAFGTPEEYKDAEVNEQFIDLRSKWQ